MALHHPRMSGNCSTADGIRVVTNFCSLAPLAGLRGLNNLGSTCFLNVVRQVLALHY